MNLLKYIACAVCAIAATTIHGADLRQTVAEGAGSYSTLLSRFNAGETLTPGEITVVYYGSASQPGFNASATYPAVMNAYNAGDYAKAYSLATKALDTDPTNLALLFKAYACAASMTDPTANAQASKLQNRLLQICDIIFASGQGVTDSSPYMVTRPSDMDEFLSKYIQPTAIRSRATVGGLQAVKATIEGVPDEVILYFSQFK